MIWIYSPYSSALPLLCLSLNRCQCFKFLKRDVHSINNGDVLEAKWKLISEDLRVVASKQHAARYNYLKVNILDRYYPPNEAVKKAFIVSGIDEDVSPQP
eukprot:IDg2201t1